MEVRWQLIRSFETSLTSQNENLELRKLIARARSDREADKAAYGEKIKKFGMSSLNQINALRDELVRLKTAHGEGLAEHGNYMTKVNGRMQQMAASVSDDASAMLELQDENQRLKLDIDRMEKELADVQAIKGTDAQRNAKTIEELRAQLGDADTQNKEYSEKIEALETQVKNEVLTRESLTEEVKRLRLWVTKMEEKGLMAAAEAEEQKQEMENEHALAVQALTQEGNTLRGTIAFLQEELYRVQTALHVPPTNSHFGKFVELKSENRQLQSKLETTLRAQASNPLPNSHGPGHEGPASASASVASSKGVKRVPPKGMKGNKLAPPGEPQRSPRVVPPRAQPPGGEMRSSSGQGGGRQKLSVELPLSKTVV